MKSTWLSAASVLALPVLVAALSGACSSDTVDDNPDGGGSSSGSTTTTTDAVLENYATNLYAAYGASLKDAQDFKVLLQALVTTPSQATLDAAKTGWLASRANYMLTEGARFYDGPIDESEHNYEGSLNSWPLDEAYIDYVQDGPTRTPDEAPGSGGIIADTSIPLTAEGLIGLNGKGGDENISAGYHAIEFLLWGQVLVDVGPGTRPYTDYVPTDATHGATAVRRGQYLLAVVDGIIADLTAVHDAWAPNAAYRTTFLANKDGESLQNVFSGLGKMSKGELAGERINAGLESKARRDQHNCFSSTTLTDYARDATGIRDLWLGNYAGNDGPGLDELVAAKDPAAAAAQTAQLDKSITAITSIKVPFEEAIQGLDTDPNRAALIGVRESLRAQGDGFGTTAALIGVSLTVPDTN